MHRVARRIGNEDPCLRVSVDVARCTDLVRRFRVNTEFLPDPRNYHHRPGILPPTNRETLVKEQILEFEQYQE